LVEKRSSDITLHEEYADVLAANPQRFDDAKKEYEYVLSKNGSIKTREKYANHLSTRQSQRGEAQKQYAVILKSDPSNVPVRMKYARLLSARKETTPEAIRQYETVLKYQPNNGNAHAGLAKGYAWLGKKDKAAYHSKMAAKYAPKNKEVAELKRELTKGREPYVGGAVEYLYQPGDWNGINGVFLGLQGRYDLLPELTVNGKIGFETYTAGDQYQGTVKGGLFKGGAIYRFENVHAAELNLGYHTLVRTGDGMEALLQYILEVPDFVLKGGFNRELIYESVASLAGHDTYLYNRTNYIGSAKSNKFFIDIYKKLGIIEIQANPYFGWVSSEAASNNDMAGFTGGGKINIPLQEMHRGVIAYQFCGKRFRNDNSGFSIPPPKPANLPDSLDTLPGPGGYFSPQSYIGHNPRLEYHYEDNSLMEIHVSTGPTIYHFKAKAKEKSGVGIYFSGEYKRYIKENLRLTIGSGFENSGSGYSRFTLKSALDYLF
jgi:hypothetical protein